MQVIPEDVELKDSKGNWTTDYSCYLDGRPKEVINNNNTIDHNRSIYPDIYAIGDERDKITIRSDGVLHFAVNDIALTRKIIMEMKEKVQIGKKKGKYKDTSELEIGLFPIPNNNKDTNLFKEEMNELLKGLKNIGFEGKHSDTMKLGFEFNKKKDWDENYRELYDTVKWYDTVKLHDIVKKNFVNDTSLWRRNFSELDYYLITNFVDAWFVDNAGSYLIVIERKKQ